MTDPTPRAFFSGARPRIAGHRGAAGTLPENTLVSFRRALEGGGNFLEMDVHATRDGEVVIIHDATVERTTDGAGAVAGNESGGVEAARRRVSLHGRRRLDVPVPRAGHPHPHPAGVLRGVPPAKATVEIKELPAPAMESLFDLVEEFGRAVQVLVAAEDDATMRSARAVIRERGLPVATGFSTGEIRALMTALWSGHTAPARSARPSPPDPAPPRGHRSGHARVLAPPTPWASRCTSGPSTTPTRMRELLALGWTASSRTSGPPARRDRSIEAR